MQSYLAYEGNTSCRLVPLRAFSPWASRPRQAPGSGGTGTSDERCHTVTPSVIYLLKTTSPCLSLIFFFSNHLLCFDYRLGAYRIGSLIDKQINRRYYSSITYLMTFILWKQRIKKGTGKKEKIFNPVSWSLGPHGSVIVYTRRGREEQARARHRQ